MRPMDTPTAEVLSIEPLVLHRFGLQEDLTSAAPVVQAFRTVLPFIECLARLQSH